MQINGVNDKESCVPLCSVVSTNAHASDQNSTCFGMRHSCVLPGCPLKVFVHSSRQFSPHPFPPFLSPEFFSLLV